MMLLQKKEQTREGKGMETGSSTGRWFSEMKDCWQAKQSFYINTSGRRKMKNTDILGICRTDRRCGAVIGSMGQAFPTFSLIQIVDDSGRELSYTLAESMKEDPCHYPVAVAASPFGQTLVWITEGRLWTWQMDPFDGFASEDGS